MNAVKVHLTSHPEHYMLLMPVAVWFAFPEPRGTRLYLRHQLEADVQPSAVPTLSNDDRLLMLHKIHLMQQTGSVVEVTADITEVCNAFGLLPFTGRDKSGGFELALAADVVQAISPAFDRDGKTVGSNIYMRKFCLEADGPTLGLMEDPATVCGRLGWAIAQECGAPADPDDAPEIAPPAIIIPQ